ncbi:MAG: recombinase family protein, partial [Dehalococcoidia bacterium]
MSAALKRIIKRVALYCRVSDAKQAEKELSIPSQIKALEKYAHDHGWEVVRIYIDEAQSGRTANRPVFQEMMAEAKQVDPPFDAVLVWKLDRFARNREDSVLYKSYLRRKGIQIISLNEHIEDSAQGRFVEAVFEANAQLFSENLAQD